MAGSAPIMAKTWRVGCRRSATPCLPPAMTTSGHSPSTRPVRSPRPRGRTIRHTWPSSCRSSLPTRRAYEPGAGLRTRLSFLQHANDLLFREPQSLHLSVIQSGPDSNQVWMEIRGHVAGRQVDEANLRSQLLRPGPWWVSTGVLPSPLELSVRNISHLL